MHELPWGPLSCLPLWNGGAGGKREELSYDADETKVSARTSGAWTWHGPSELSAQDEEPGIVPQAHCPWTWVMYGYGENSSEPSAASPPAVGVSAPSPCLGPGPPAMSVPWHVEDKQTWLHGISSVWKLVTSLCPRTTDPCGNDEPTATIPSGAVRSWVTVTMAMQNCRPAHGLPGLCVPPAAPRPVLSASPTGHFLKHVQTGQQNRPPERTWDPATC